MKACPICQSTYEDWIEFCFNEGVPLVAHESKPASRPSLPQAPLPVSSSYDAPEARLVSGASLPEPANLSRASGRAAPPAGPAKEPAPLVAKADPVAPAEVEAPLALPVLALVAPPPPADLDADAMNDIASALGAPPPSDSARIAPPVPAPVTFHPPLTKESEDGKATLPMYTAHPDDAPAGRSVLDEEPSRKAVAGAGIGVALIGVLALGAFLLVAAIGVWWTMSRGGEPSTAVREPVAVASQALPAAAEPAPVVPMAVDPATVPAVTEAAVEPPALPAAAIAAPATVAATSATAMPTSRPPTAATTRGPTGTTGATASTTRTTPATPTPTSTRAALTPVTAAAGTSTVATDNVWGTPTAPTSGFLRIVTDPDGASVYVNDAGKGKTPVTIELPYGAHQVRVVRAGYKTEVRDVNIRIREMTVPFNLKPDVVTGQVNVYGPDGFRVVVDGHDMGPMPVTVQVSEGVRQFKLVGSEGSTCNLPKEIKFKAGGRPETTITLACP